MLFLKRKRAARKKKKKKKNARDARKKKELEGLLDKSLKEDKEDSFRQTEATEGRLAEFDRNSQKLFGTILNRSDDPPAVAVVAVDHLHHAGFDAWDKRAKTLLWELNGLVVVAAAFE